MANEALQNQALLDQMFARSLAPINQALEVQRQRVQQQQDWERNMAQRERELMMEQTFRAQQNKEQLAAQSAQFTAQQQAIDKREAAAFERTTAQSDLERIRATPLLSEKEKAEAEKNPEKRKEYVAKIANLSVEEDVKSVKAIASQAEEAMKEAVYAMATESKNLPPEAVRAATDKWLLTQDEKVKAALYPIIQGGGTITPATVDAALKSARGMFGTGLNGINDGAIMDAALSYRVILGEVAGGSKDLSPGAQRAVQRFRDLQGQMQELVKTPSGRMAANRFVQEKQAESDTLKSEFAKKNSLQKSIETQFGGGQPLSGWETGANFLGASQEEPGASAQEYGGVVGGISSAAQAVPGVVSSAGNWLYNAGNSVTDFGAGLLGGQKLVDQQQAARSKAEADLQALMQSMATNEPVNARRYGMPTF